MDIKETRKKIHKFRGNNSYYSPSRLDRPEEIKKAVVKNHNLPILNLIYNGDPDIVIHCMISKNAGFLERRRINSNEQYCYCLLEFNHICQKWNYGTTGLSIHKGNQNPSEIIRRHYLNDNLMALDQMIKCIPVTATEHAIITQDSQSGNIDLSCYEQHQWPWILRSRKNYEFVVDLFNLYGTNEFPDYDLYMSQMFL